LNSMQLQSGDSDLAGALFQPAREESSELVPLSLPPSSTFSIRRAEYLGEN
jgi:hypothetical protein